MDIDLMTIALLVGAAFLAGFVDTIAGGGGMIGLPALLLTGMSPLEAVATNKFQSTFGSGMATWRFWRAGHIDVAQVWPAFLAALTGGTVGALLLSVIDAAILTRVMPVLLIAVALYFAFAPAMSEITRPARLGRTAFALGVALPIATYDGIFGPGTGSFLAAALVAFAGLGVLKATAHTKALNFASNVASFIVFLFGGHIIYALGVPMAAAQLLGARLGAATAMTHGARIIRPLLVIVTIAVALRLLLR